MLNFSFKKNINKLNNKNNKNKIKLKIKIIKI